MPIKPHRRTLTTAGPAPMWLPSIPMHSIHLPNTWVQYERQYNKRLYNRHAVHLQPKPEPLKPTPKVRTRQTI